MSRRKYHGMCNAIRKSRARKRKELAKQDIISGIEPIKFANKEEEEQAYKDAWDKYIKAKKSLSKR